jgi:hypothetical protein
MRYLGANIATDAEVLRDIRDCAVHFDDNALLACEVTKHTHSTNLNTSVERGEMERRDGEVPILTTGQLFLHS